MKAGRYYIVYDGRAALASPILEESDVGRTISLLADNDIHCGVGVKINVECLLDSSRGPIHLDDNVILQFGCRIYGPCRIGKDCILSPGVTVMPIQHRFENPAVPINTQGGVEDEIILQKDVYVGANTTILKGVMIGEGAVIGACSLVNKNIPSKAVAYGTPAKIRRYRGRRAADTHQQEAGG